MPEDCDIEDNEILLKDSEAEDRAIEDISLAVRGFFVKSSKWSSLLPEEKVNIILFRSCTILRKIWSMMKNLQKTKKKVPHFIILYLINI